MRGSVLVLPTHLRRRGRLRQSISSLNRRVGNNDVVSSERHSTPTERLEGRLLRTASVECSSVSSAAFPLLLLPLALRGTWVSTARHREHRKARLRLLARDLTLVALVHGDKLYAR